MNQPTLDLNSLRNQQSTVVQDTLIAGEKGLITDVEAWYRYRKMRAVTSYTCDRVKAREVYRDTAAFTADAALPLSRLEATHD